MDITRATPNGSPVTNTTGAAPNLIAYDKDHINDLLSSLTQVDRAVGAPLPKTRLAAGVVGIDLPAERLLEAATIIRDSLGFDMLTCVSGVDMVDHVESVYHFRALSQNWTLQARVRLPNNAPEVDSLVSLYPSANWLERETYDLYGIIYRGHPDLRRILLDDEFFGHPLLKSFRPTPLTIHDRATTQTNGVRAVAGEQQRLTQKVTTKHLGQGMEERLHPGKVTFGSAAVFLETGQGLDGPAGVHGYIVNADTPAGATPPNTTETPAIQRPEPQKG